MQKNQAVDKNISQAFEDLSRLMEKVVYIIIVYHSVANTSCNDIIKRVFYGVSIQMTGNDERVWLVNFQN